VGGRKKHKQYVLSDGSSWTATAITKKTGLSLTTIRSRLCRTIDVDKIFNIDVLMGEGRTKTYTLTDGTKFTVKQVMQIAGINRACAGARFARSRDPKVIFAPAPIPKEPEEVKTSKLIATRMCYDDRSHWLLLARFT